MAFIDRFLKQDLTIFTKVSVDLYGKPTWAVSYTKCRWEDKQMEFVDGVGSKDLSSAVVYVNTDIPVGCYVYEGISHASAPPSTARSVKVFSRVPSVDGRKYVKMAILK